MISIIVFFQWSIHIICKRISASTPGPIYLHYSVNIVQLERRLSGCFLQTSTAQLFVPAWLGHVRLAKILFTVCALVLSLQVQFLLTPRDWTWIIFFQTSKNSLLVRFGDFEIRVLQHHLTTVWWEKIFRAPAGYVYATNLGKKLALRPWNIMKEKKSVIG